MKPLHTTIAFVFLFVLLPAMNVQSAEHNNESHNYLLGRGIADVTGPVLGAQMMGYSYDGQVTEGIHTRLKSRAFIIAEPGSDKRVVFVSADLATVEHDMTLAVIDRLQLLFGELYSRDNIILSASHTHSGPGGYLELTNKLEKLGEFSPQHFYRIVDGIVNSIAAAHADLQPGTLRINKGNVEGAGINRSLTAYQENPEQERAHYENNIDKEMTLLKLSGDTGDIGMINWYAVHATSMTYQNRLISGDHKGYASLTIEREKNLGRDTDGGFVAAFAQTSAGDVTSNLNLDNTGPGVNDFDSTKIIGDKQLQAALDLFENASEKVVGKIDYRQLYVDFSNYEVLDQFTHSGSQYTCPAAYGYSVGAGSTEDGGGHSLFREGMIEQSWWMDLLIRTKTGNGYTQELSDCQSPKPVLWDFGEDKSRLYYRIRSVSVVRIGQLVILAVPAEVTTMAGRRLRSTVMAQLGDWAQHIVLAGYSNGYTSYVTTPEEYQIQQYEGGQTLHGPWTLPAYQQVSAQLATALENETTVEQSVDFDDRREKSALAPTVIDDALDSFFTGVSFGDAVALERTSYQKDDIVEVTFRSANPARALDFDKPSLLVEQKINNTWTTIYTDHDWSTRIRWQESSGAYTAQVTWHIPDDIEPGEYRIRHFGQHADADGKMKNFVGASNNLTVHK